MIPDPDPDADTRLGPPRWTQARLTRVLIVKYGHSARGGVNVTAAAADLGVSARTLYRWLQAPDGRHRAQIPSPRLEALVDSLLPNRETLDDEIYQLEHYRSGITGWNARPQRLNPSWKPNGWLAAHQVSVLKLHALPLYQVALTSAPRRGTPPVHYPRGAIVDSLRVPTRMHAYAVALQLLQIHHRWRVHAPSIPGIRTGRTWCWFSDAPPTELVHTQFTFRPTGDPAAKVVTLRAAP